MEKTWTHFYCPKEGGHYWGQPGKREPIRPQRLCPEHWDPQSYHEGPTQSPEA